jgi:hypothetical protein
MLTWGTVPILPVTLLRRMKNFYELKIEKLFGICYFFTTRFA